MSESLYPEEIKLLAARTAPRLPAPTATIVLDNPLCGDRVTLDVRVEDGQVTALGYEVKGCLLCRAAAAALAARAPGQPLPLARALAGEVETMLKGNAAPAWDELAAFLPARPHKSRHGCVTLPFQALKQALG